jgi:outer membrane protein assembly factor BamD
MFKKALILIISAMTLVTLQMACSSGPETKADDPEAQFKAAEEYDKDERYEEAIRRYQEIKNKFPYSKYAILSELAVADAYFKQESYPEAQVAYANFKDLHPKHLKIDYVVMQLGLSYYNQLPATQDRDLAVANSAITNFDDLLNRFPKSEFVKDAQEKKQKTLLILAKKEMYIADFYFKKEQWLSAMNRYEGEVRKYPGQGFEDKALARAAICSARLANLDHARTLLKELKERYPGSPEIGPAEKELQ